MDPYTIIYTNENKVYKKNKEYILHPIKIDDFVFENYKFNYQLCLFFIDNQFIIDKNEKEVSFNSNYKYIFLQNKYPYKRIILDYIYTFDIYVNLVSSIMINHDLLLHIKKIISQITKKIESFKLDKIKYNDDINISTFDIRNIEYILHHNVLDIKENHKNMESIFKKVSVTPKKIKILYRGIDNVLLPNHYFETKYISTSIDPVVSIGFLYNKPCCFQILYNINVPYVILNDSEKEYILQSNFYYHKLHTDVITLIPYDEPISVKVIHYIISTHKLSSTELKEIKNTIDVKDSIIKLYNNTIYDNSDYEYANHALSVIDNSQSKDYYTWDKKYYKKKYKSLNNEELETIVDWKQSSSNINSYIYFNKSLYYSIIYNLNHETPIHKIQKINANINQFFKLNYFSSNIKDLYQLLIFNNNDTKNLKEITLHPGLMMKEFNKYICIYYSGGIIFDMLKNNTINIYPNNVEIKKNQIYYGNMNGIFDTYVSQKIK